MKKRLIPLILSILILLALPSCSTGGGITLKLMGKKSDLEKNYMKKIFDLYEESTGNRLEIISVDDQDYENEALKRFENGTAPDIFLHFHNADLNLYDVEGDFRYLNDESWVSDLSEGALSYCTDKDGNLLGLPFWESSVSGCYYNKTLLDSLGLKPASTQAEFDMLCQALVETGVAPICWPADGCSWMAQFGLDPIFADDPVMLEKINSGEIGYSDIPQVRDMTVWLSEAAEKGWFGDDYLSTGWDGISPTLSSGSAAMTFIWDTWFYTDFKDGGKYSIDDFALMPIFMNTAPNGTYEGGNLNMMMVNKNGDKVEAALEFLEFCATPENYNAAFEGISTVSCFKGQTTNIQSKMVTDAEQSIKENERVSTAASRIMGYNAEDMMTALNRMFRNKITVDECIAEMDSSRVEEIARGY